MNTTSLPQDLMSHSLIHFEQGVPIDDLNLRPDQRRRLARVEHVYWQWMRNPLLDPFGMFKQLCKGKFADAPSEWRAAQRDKLLFDFIVESITPPSRKISEARVRYAGNKLMEMGMQTDNGHDIEAGAKIIIKVDHLDQPEQQHDDLSKVKFLPTIVTTAISEIDDTKEDIEDAEARRIMNRWGGYIDDKRKAVDDRVDAMMAKRGPEEDERDNNS